MRCWILHEKILPSLRYYLARKLYEKGYSQKEIARKLLVSQANVSYYLNNRRIKNKIKISENIINEIVKKLEKEDLTIKDIICEFCPILTSNF